MTREPPPPACSVPTAEAVGFEPTVTSLPRRFSSPIAAAEPNWPWTGEDSTLGARHASPWPQVGHRQKPCDYGELAPRQRLRGALVGEQPRQRGEQPADFGVVMVELGTAPRVRGARSAGVRKWTIWGNSPAGAGSTPSLSVSPPCPGEQPRGCGEHAMTRSVASPPPGTAPRVRGARIPSGLTTCSMGNSPAGAGSTRFGASFRAPNWEQPRGCGEHASSLVSAIARVGTAPRVRGAPPGHPVRPRVGGNSPAGAGSTPTDPRLGRRPREQPRGCGEHTPPSAASPTSREQPRGCGEHVTVPATVRPTQGTAPRVRGALGEGPPRPGADGNSPAGAGSTVRDLVL